MHIPILNLTPDTFAPYGKVIEKPTRPTDATGPGWHWWGEMTTLAGGDRPYAIGYLDLTPAPLRFDWAERHMHSDELVAPLGGDCLVYVAPADYPDQPDRLPALDQFKVFRVISGQAVIFNKGVWHGAPMAENTPLNALVLLLHNTGVQDGYVCRFEETPIEIGD